MTITRRSRNFRLLFAAVVATAAFNSSGLAQSGRTLTGTVMDSLRTPIRYVHAQVGRIGAVGNDSGRFVVTLESSTAVTLEIRRIGYQPITMQVPEGGDSSFTIILRPAAQRLASVRVVAEQVRRLETVGFYERLALQKKWGGAAHFITPEEIELRRPTRTTQMFDGFTGVKTRRALSCAVILRCWVPVGTGNCVMAVYLDGVRLEPEPPLDKPRQQRPLFIDELVHPSEISAMEVYSRPIQAPPQYQADTGSCGVILIWTK